MKSRIITLLLALGLISIGQAQPDIPEKKLKTTITEATVFLNGAQVLREGKTSISSGTTDIIIEKLPVRLDPTSIQVKGEGAFTIMAVTPRRIDPPKVEFVVDEDKIARLNEEKKNLQIRLNHTAVQRQAFDEEEKLLNESRAKLSSYTEGGLSIDDVDKAAALYRRRFAELKEKQWQNGRQQARLQQSIDSLATVIAKLQTPIPIEQVQEKPTYEVKVTVSAKRTVSNAAIELSYLVAAAGWLPSYDIRVTEVGKPVYLGFRAQVYQATEEDWRDVKLSLSTGNPSRNSIKPDLKPWYLDYYNRSSGNTVRYSEVTQATGPYNASVRRIRGTVIDGTSGEPLIGATIIFQGTSVGTFADVNGQYELAVPEGARAIEVKYIGYATQALNVSNEIMNVRMSPVKALLEEVAITAMKSSVAGVVVTEDRVNDKKDIQLGKTLPLVVNRVERAANQLYEIEAPYSIAGDGRRFAVDVMQYELPADYAYASAPKLDANAYLTARVPDWNAFNLMEGDARLFFEDAYLGKTILQTNTVVDTLVLSLGVDDGVVIEREKLRDESRSQLLGLTRKETRVFEIAIRNTKSQPIRLLLEDQIPVSRDKSINVKLEEAEGAEYDEERGLINWDITLQPGETRRIRLSYVVKYPADKNLYLE